MIKKRVKEKAIAGNVLLVKRFFKEACLPEYMLKTDVGLDLRANETVVLKPLEQRTVKTGIAIRIPEGHVGLVRDRAGMVSKMNVHTAAGTFDPAYRGEVSIVLINFGDDAVEIEKGMRIAQMVIMPITKVEVREVDKLDVTERYDKGFGSTGFKDKLKNFHELAEELGEE